MKRLFSKILFFVLGWKVIGLKAIPNRCIIVAAPHTSNWDFLFGRCFAYISRIKPKYLAKSELFVPIIGYLLRVNGGIPVYRNSNNNIVSQVVMLFKKRKEFILAIAPEGTRKRVNKWKTGFYYIALEAKIPILLAGLDYKRKEIGIISRFLPTGDINKDMSHIQNQFKELTPKYSENYNINIF